jgi:hypothetical protein
MIAFSSNQRVWLATALFLVPGLASAQQTVLNPIFPAPLAIQFNEEANLQQVVDKVNRQLDEFWAKNKVHPSETASDAEFLRRASLDIVGQIPFTSEVRDFLDSKDPQKRAKKIDELLNRPAFINHFTTTLRREWVPQTFENPQLEFVGFQFEGWVREKLKKQTSMDQMVRELLTAPTLFARGRPVNDFNENASPTAFNQANEFKPENVAAAASRLFMGVKLECCQCHNHPFNSYKREQFWEQAAFFAEVQPTIANISDVTLKREIKIPESPTVVQAKFFDGKNPQWNDSVSPRETYVNWLVSDNNPFFARNMVNRMWSHFFGLGFIEPIDEPGAENPPMIPAVEEELVQAFIASKYDMRFLMKAIARSKVYSLSSKMTHKSQENPRLFARMNLKGLSAEQVFDSLAVATGYSDSILQGRRFNNFGTTRGEFLTKFSTTEKRIEQQTSILQALTLMNGKFINDQTHLERSQTLAIVIDAPFLKADAKLETLFIAALSRKPTKEEMEKFSSYVERGGATDDKKKALADVFWSLLNSTEFILNH